MQGRYQNEARKDSNMIIFFGKQQKCVCVCQRSHIDLQVGSLFCANMTYGGMLQVDF